MKKCRVCGKPCMIKGGYVAGLCRVHYVLQNLIASRIKRSKPIDDLEIPQGLGTEEWHRRIEAYVPTERLGVYQFERHPYSVDQDLPERMQAIQRRLVWLEKRGINPDTTPCDVCDRLLEGVKF